MKERRKKKRFAHIEEMALEEKKKFNNSIVAIEAVVSFKPFLIWT